MRDITIRKGETRTLTLDVLDENGDDLNISTGYVVDLDAGIDADSLSIEKGTAESGDDEIIVTSGDAVATLVAGDTSSLNCPVTLLAEWTVTKSSDSTVNKYRFNLKVLDSLT